MSSLNAAAISKPFLSEVAQSAAVIAAKLKRKPRLLGILANADEPSRLYAKSTEKACVDAGLDFELLSIGSKEEPSQPFDVEQVIIEANLNDEVDGIMTYFPVCPSTEISCSKV